MFSSLSNFKLKLGERIKREGEGKRDRGPCLKLKNKEGNRSDGKRGKGKGDGIARLCKIQ